MARISELHYSNAYARDSGVAEFLEVALDSSEDPANFTVSFYQDSGLVGFEVSLNHPDVRVAVDPDNGEVSYIISADDFPIFLTDPDGGGSTNYEAYALINTDTGAVIDFYDIGGGTQNILAQDGLAAGATSENVPVVVGPEQTRTTLQWNQPHPDTAVYEPLNPGDTGLACFVTGTRLDTPDGPRAIETLKIGDLVETVDHGPQPVRWIGQRTVDGTGKSAPVLLRKGALGAKRDMRLSPQHRVMLTGWRAELHFGEAEVLVPVYLLADDHRILRQPVMSVTYVHLLFDRHELVRAEGVIAESFLPGPLAINAWDHAARDEILDLFPELRARVEGWRSARSIREDRTVQLMARMV